MAHRFRCPSEAPVRIAVVGLGYWGPNLARNFNALPGVELRWICDGSQEQIERVGVAFPNSRKSTDLDEVLVDEGCNAVVIATPVPSHARLAKRVLAAGKHCFVEKPLAQSVAEAEDVVAAARDADRLIMVGHLLEYHPGLERLKELCDSDQLGQMRYIYSHRLNLGKLRSDENALWSLGAHDISVVLRLAGAEPDECHAFGESYMRPGIEDVVFCFLRFASGVSAHLHLSWLDPHKERRFTVVGSSRMATFDDMQSERKLTVYDKGFDPNAESYVQRSGDIWSPRISNDEPLRVECQHFVDAIRGRVELRSNGDSGLRVVRVLEELQNSLNAHSTSLSEVSTIDRPVVASGITA